MRQPIKKKNTLAEEYLSVIVWKFNEFIGFTGVTFLGFKKLYIFPNGTIPEYKLNAIIFIGVLNWITSIPTKSCTEIVSVL